MTFSTVYLLEPSEPPPLAVMGDIRMSITWAEHNAAVTPATAAAIAATGTNTYAGDRAHAAAATATVSTRGG